MNVHLCVSISCSANGVSDNLTFSFTAVYRELMKLKLFRVQCEQFTMHEGTIHAMKITFVEFACA